MYESHFGFSELPFCLTPDTQFYHESTWHREAGIILDICIGQGEGFIKIVGEVGTGKTMLCRRLLSSLPDVYCPVYIPNPYLSPEGLFHAIAHELGIRVNGNNSHVILNAIEEELVQLAVLGHKVILIVDEAQSMPAETLEALRLVTNLETEKMKLLQVVLFGQPELDFILQQTGLRQLLQRITFSYHLQPLDYQATVSYVEHRLQCAGHTGSISNGTLLFDERALKTIYAASVGTPRIINVLAHKSLMCAYGAREREVTRDFVLAAIDDTESVSRPSRFSQFSFSRAAALASAALPVMSLVNHYIPELTL